MTELLARGDRGTVAGDRSEAVASYSARAECLRIQAETPRQSRLGRFFGLSPLGGDARSWYRAAIGEQQIVALLDSLGQHWTVLQTDPTEVLGSNLDHLVIGPGGVFLVSAKNHAGQRVFVGDDTLLVNGHRTNHLRDSRYQATRVAQILSSGADEAIDVTPVIALVDPGSLGFGKVRPAGVLVIASSQLAQVLGRRPTRLADATVRSLAARARQRGSWHSPELAVEDERFEHLRDRVDAASRRRLLWIACATLAVLVAVGALIVVAASL